MTGQAGSLTIHGFISAISDVLFGADVLIPPAPDLPIRFEACPDQVMFRAVVDQDVSHRLATRRHHRKRRVELKHCVVHVSPDSYDVLAVSLTLAAQEAASKLSSNSSQYAAVDMHLSTIHCVQCRTGRSRCRQRPCKPETMSHSLARSPSASITAYSSLHRCSGQSQAPCPS